MYMYIYLQSFTVPEARTLLNICVLIVAHAALLSTTYYYYVIL